MLSNKTVLVTGASSGIGLAIAQELSSAGATVIMTARNPNRLLEAAKTVSRSIPISADISNDAEVESLVGEIQKQFPVLDFLINNAGIGIFNNIEDLTVDDWNQTIATNLTGPFLVSKHCLPLMQKASAAHIINIASLASKNAFAGGVAYNASKFGLLGFSEALMHDLRYQDIRVTTILPGSTDSSFGGAPSETDWKIRPVDVAEAVIYALGSNSRITLGQIEIRPSKPKKK